MDDQRNNYLYVNGQGYTPTSVVREFEVDAELWRALKADCEADPCRYPCLRDDLHDWLMARASGNGGDDGRQV